MLDGHEAGIMGPAGRLPDGRASRRCRRIHLRGDRTDYGMSHRHSDVAPEPRAPNADTADPGPARRWDCSKDGSFTRRDRPEKTMMDCKKLREVLDAYVDRELSADAAGQAERHTA